MVYPITYYSLHDLHRKVNYMQQWTKFSIIFAGPKCLSVNAASGWFTCFRRHHRLPLLSPLPPLSPLSQTVSVSSSKPPHHFQFRWFRWLRCFRWRPTDYSATKFVSFSVRQSKRPVRSTQIPRQMRCCCCVQFQRKPCACISNNSNRNIELISHKVTIDRRGTLWIISGWIE